MFPVLDCSPEDFFRDGKAVIGFYHHILAGSKFKKRVRNSDHQARKALGMAPGLFYVRPQHTCSPMLRSESESLYEFSKDVIFMVVSQFRTTENFNQYLYLDYLYYQGKTVRGKISNKHLSPAVHNHEVIASHILEPSTKFLCINDVSMSDESYARYSDAVLSAFQKHFPSPSRFEMK